MLNFPRFKKVTPIKGCTPQNFTLITMHLCSGGYCNSIELYTCQKETQSLVISQIANWIQAERYSSDVLINSVLFASLGILFSHSK